MYRYSCAYLHNLHCSNCCRLVNEHNLFACVHVGHRSNTCTHNACHFFFFPCLNAVQEARILKYCHLSNKSTAIRHIQKTKCIASLSLSLSQKKRKKDPHKVCTCTDTNTCAHMLMLYGERF